MKIARAAAVSLLVLLVVLWPISGAALRPKLLSHYEGQYTLAATIEAGSNLLPVFNGAREIDTARRFAAAYRDLRESNIVTAAWYCFALDRAAQNMGELPAAPPQPAPREQRVPGVKVRSVRAGSAVERAGVSEFYLLLEVDGVAVFSAAECRRLIRDGSLLHFETLGLKLPGYVGPVVNIEHASDVTFD